MSYEVNKIWEKIEEMNMVMTVSDSIVDCCLGDGSGLCGGSSLDDDSGLVNDSGLGSCTGDGVGGCRWW